jgi:hypothetical protein
LALFATAVPFFAIFVALSVSYIFQLDFSKFSAASNPAAVIMLGLAMFAVPFSVMAHFQVVGQSGYDSLVFTKTTQEEVGETCDFLSRNTNPGDRVLALPLDTEVYYFCDRAPAGRNVLYYLPQPPETEEALKRELQSALDSDPPPRYVFLYSKPGLSRNYIDSYILNMTAVLLQNNFTKTGQSGAFDVYEKRQN